MSKAICNSTRLRSWSTITMAMFLATGLGAQASTVIPEEAVKVDASNSTAWPFGLALPSRMQGLYSGRLFSGNPAAIKSLAFRAQGAQMLDSKKGVEVEILLSTSQRTPWNLDAEFGKNTGPDEKIVFQRRKIDLPASTQKLSPQAFLVRFPLDSSFSYRSGAGALLVEIRVHGIPAGAYELDASYTECARHVEVAGSCGGFAQQPGGGVAVTKGTTTQCGAHPTDPYISYDLTGGPAGGVALHMISSRQLATPVLLPLGKCPLALAPEIGVVLTLDGSGATTVRYPLQLLHGKKSFFSQFVAVDLGLSNIRASQALRTRLGGWDAIARTVAIGKVDAATGFVQPGASWVLELGH